MTKYNDYSKEINKFFNIDLYNVSPENKILKNNYNLYCNKLDFLRELIISDLGPASPEFNEVETNLFNGAWKSQSENFNVITRYFEDNEYVRAYCCYPYSEGVMILFDKKLKSYNIIIIEEDNSVWFPSHYYYGTSINKSSFIYLLTEVISIFNSNFNSELYDT